MAAMSGAWLRKKVRHPWLGRPLRLTMYLCERRSKSALFCRHHLGDGECRSISRRPVQPVGPMVANDGWAGEPLSRPIAAEGGGRRPAFTVAASPAKPASRVDRLLAGIIRHAIVLDEVSACGTLNLCPI